MLKDVAGSSSEELELAAGATLESVFRHYVQRFPRFDDYSRSIVVARNRQFQPPSTPLSDGDEVAFLPPVSGGSGYLHEIEDPEGHFFALSRAPIHPQAIHRRLLRGEDGAVCTFEGVVRNNSAGRATRYLEYECYEAMAIQVMARIGREIAAAHAISRIALVHRLGTMQIGETSVIVAVTAPHRRPSFDAALEGINRLKKLVPIWKKEFYEDGEVWVDGDWDPSVIQR